MAKERFLFLLRLDNNLCHTMKHHTYLKFISNVLNRHLSQHQKPEGSGKTTDLAEAIELPSPRSKESVLNNYHEGAKDKSGNEFDGWKWKLEAPWFSKTLVQALQIFKWASSVENSGMHKVPPSSRSLAEIFTDLQRSRAGVQDWSLGDFTVGLYLVCLRQTSTKKDDVKGVQIFSDSIVQDLIYHVELAKGAYKGSAAGLAKHSMLQEKNIFKFVKDSSVMRPGYYIGTDVRNKLVVFGIRGTDTVYDIVTDIISASDKKDKLFEGFSTHFGTAESARWFLYHELKYIRKCMEKHKGFRLRIVGHSLGGASAALLAIMLRKKSEEELGFDPDIVSAVGFGTPPCLSKNLAEGCSDYVSTVVMQDDIIPRLSVTSLTRLRNEIIQTDWMSAVEREDLKSVIDWISNAKQAVSLVQDVAQKLSQYTNFRSISNSSDTPMKVPTASSDPSPRTNAVASTVNKPDGAPSEELFLPGTLYYLKKHVDISSHNEKGGETCTLWKMQATELPQRILLSGNLLSDHKCDNHYYALRDVLKGLHLSNG